VANGVKAHGGLSGLDAGAGQVRDSGADGLISNRPDLTQHVACMRTPGNGERRLLSIVSQDQLRSVLRFMLDESEFLSPYGIRAISRYHKDHPYTLRVNGTQHRVDYEPAESSTGLFGGTWLLP